MCFVPPLERLARDLGWTLYAEPNWVPRIAAGRSQIGFLGYKSSPSTWASCYRCTRVIGSLSLNHSGPHKR